MFNNMQSIINPLVLPIMVRFSGFLTYAQSLTHSSMSNRYGAINSTSGL